ncbi:hypothetical protein Q7P35_012561 [Cladosporium inversicolor]
MIDRLCHYALRISRLAGLCARSARSTPRGRTSVPDNIGQSQSRQASMSPAKSKLARVYQCSHPLPAAAAAASAAEISYNAKAQIDYQIDSQQEAWHLPGDGHGLRRPAAGPREPSDTVWADSVASLFTAAARRVRRHRPLSKACRDRSHCALHSRCCPVLSCTLGRAINSEQANAAAAGGRNCFFQTHGFKLSIKYRAACWPSSSSQFPLHISLTTNIGGSLGSAASTQSQRQISEPQTLGGHYAAIRTGVAESKKANKLRKRSAVQQCSTAVGAEQHDVSRDSSPEMWVCVWAIVRNASCVLDAASAANMHP